ncbi:MAG TPA: hypothetical protein VIQ81_05010, partial [Gammaproteobacteria bacterium]
VWNKELGQCPKRGVADATHDCVPSLHAKTCQDLIPKKAEWITIHSAFFYMLTMPCCHYTGM